MVHILNVTQRLPRTKRGWLSYSNASVSQAVLLLTLLWCCTLVPMPPALDIRGWGCTNPINDPTWTLQFEYLANILYALVFRHLSRLALGVCCAVAAFFTLSLTLNWDFLGLLASRPAMAYTVVGGWMLTPSQVYIGLIRLAFPFLSGMLLARYGRFIRLRGGFGWCAALILVLTAMPRLGGTEAMWVNGLYEALVIIALFPLILSIGAGSEVRGKRAQSVCKFLGFISYPLYITHFPLVYLQKSWVYYHPDAPLSTHVAVAVCVYVMAVANAWAAYKLYDLPVRAWLKARLFPAKEKRRR